MTLILTKEELDRIRGSVRPKDDAMRTSAIDRKARLKAMSAERVKHWPNTLEALRNKKETFLKDRAEKEEARRQEMDRQEAEMKREARLEAIRRANELLYDQTDKMKLLRSQKLYADVIYDRVKQVEDKRLTKEQKQEEEKKYHEEILRQVRDGDAQEREKLEQQRKAVDEVKRSRAEQREEARRIREEVLRKNREEGLRMKQEAQERLEEELRDYDRKQKFIAENNLRTAQANAELKKIREELAEQERVADEARDAEKEKIEYRKRMLKELEKQRFEKAQENRQKMIDRAVEELAKRSSHEEAILEKQQQDKRDREDREEAEKLRKAAEIKEMLAQSRTEQIAAREKERLRQETETNELLSRWRVENEAAMQAEKEKLQAARMETIRLKQQQFEDGKEAARLRAEAKMVEIEQQRFLNSIDTQDDKRFIEQCKAEIERNVKLGKPIYTLLRALEYEQPALLAAQTVKVERPKKM
eukprot:scaffold1084_cov250-Ochromonas_danica.AAC.5